MCGKIWNVSFSLLIFLFFFSKIYPLPMASPTRWIWIWANSRSWWWIGRPGVLWFMGSQRVGHDWATELNCTHFPIFQSFMSHSEMGRALTEQVLRIAICFSLLLPRLALPKGADVTSQSISLSDGFLNFEMIWVWLLTGFCSSSKLVIMVLKK